MSTKYYCDKCETEMKVYKRFTLNQGIPDSYKSFMLCASCEKLLEELLKKFLGGG